MTEGLKAQALQSDLILNPGQHASGYPGIASEDSKTYLIRVGLVRIMP